MGLSGERGFRHNRRGFRIGTAAVFFSIIRFVQRVRVLRGEKAPDDALARELGATGLL